MKFNITSRTDGLQNVRKRFDIIKRSPDRVLKITADQEKRAAESRIRSSKTDPEGRPWAPWSMNTLKQRQREGTAGKGLLYRTGALLSSIQYRISEKTLTIFSNIGYARYLQFGTPKMPARQFLGWSKEAINRVKQALKDDINDK